MINDLRFLFLRNLYYKYVRANRYPLYKRVKFDTEIQKLKGIHYGEKCFIIGNGPSLTASDLSVIKENKIPSFAANSIYKMFDKTDWRPTYYVFQDQQIIDGLAEKFYELSSFCKLMFVRRDSYFQLSREVRNKSNIMFPKVVMRIRKDRFYDFSDDLSKFSFDGCTVTYLMMQIAYYMGFKTIYLIGVDHNFPVSYDENDKIIVDNTMKLHCFKDEKSVVLNPSRALEATYAYRSAEKFCREHGVIVINATRGGKLEVFERREFDKLMSTNE